MSLPLTTSSLQRAIASAVAEHSPFRTYLPHPLKLPSIDSQPTQMAEQHVPPIDLTHFPYFPDGDIVISLSPSDAQPMALHSEVLVKYLDYFEERLKGHVYLRGLARSSRIEGLKVPGTMRYELVCKAEYEWEECESEMGMLKLKVCLYSTSLLAVRAFLV